VLVSSKVETLLKEIQYIFNYHHEFGLALDGDNQLPIMQLLESLLVFNKWCWLTRNDLEDTLRQSQFCRLLNNEHVKYLPKINNKQEETSAFQDHITSKVLFFPIISNEQQQSNTKSTFLKLYDKLSIALLIAGVYHESLHNISIGHVDVWKASQQGIVFKTLSHGIVLVPQINEDFMNQQTYSNNEKIIADLLYEIKLAEVIFLEEEDARVDAARYLFNRESQEIIESKLVSYMKNEDKLVKINVLTALGLPAYSVGFTPGKPLPPKAERIEPVTLSPKTVDDILVTTENEEDNEILDWVVCTLKTQNYTGKLRNISLKVRNYIRITIPKLKSEQTIKDCKKLLRELPN
jgi:hypothetical protein